MRWMWIDRVIELTPRTRMVAVKNVSLAEEHLHDHFPGFPVMPGGTKQCAKCHGDGNTVWTNPPSRNHPSQPKDTRSWLVACSSCHDSDAAKAHMDAQTSPIGSGTESCAVCHGVGKEWSVTERHKAQ